MSEKIPFQNPESVKQPEIPKKEEVLELEPLTDREREELDALFAKLKRGGKSYYGVKWQIVEKFGEKVVPFMIENQKLTGQNRVHFFDTLVTEKTAPMVLEAMKKGKVGIWEAAMGAAAGKEKTAHGLAEILTNLEPKSDRSNHIRLLAALGEAKVDDTVPQIVKFYERLRKDENYAAMVSKHLKTLGNNLYTNDGQDVVRALCWIDGPKAKEAIQSFASSGDEYIKSYAQAALNGELYVSHPEKYKIGKPILQTEFYSVKSDSDFKPEKATEALPKITKTSMPEQLTANATFGFLESSYGWQEEYQEYFRDYFNGKLGVFEFLGKLGGAGEVKHWQDFPKEKYGEALQAAVSLEAIKVLLKAPDLKAMGEGADNLQNYFDNWRKEEVSFPGAEASVNFNRILKRCQSLLDKFKENTHYHLKQTDFRLPESAGEFQLWHRGLEKARPIKPFTELLRGKLQNYFTREAFKILRGEIAMGSINEMAVKGLPHLFGLYREVDNYDTPIYKEAAERLEKVAKNKPLVFYGRDADYFYYAVKAQRFGLTADKKPRKVYINTSLSHDLFTYDEDREKRERILAYLLQEKVSAEAVHIDTGYRGSVPEAVLRALNPKLKDEEINSRIKLIESRADKRESLGRQEGEVATIEGRPHKYGEIKDVVRDEKTGRLKVSFWEPHNPLDGIRAWVVNQAVIRNFAPKLEAKK